jgi:3-(3-hydroxy-phenyl)propionate hydroxylase
VWVGAWRFRRRWLAKLTHGRVFFMGDAAAQHSPFGARGGNRAVQDANNLAWKLALVLQGKARAGLLDTYHDERHAAAVENVEHSTRSAVFIGPETHGQRLFRDAILDLASREAWARRWVNVGRLSVATVYEGSKLNVDGGSFENQLARPGAAAPDGRTSDGFFVERLSGDFKAVYFGKDLGRRGHEALFDRYGVEDEATYVFRPDGHVLARRAGIDPRFARDAIDSVFSYRNP